MTNLATVVSMALSTSLLTSGNSHLGRTPHDNLFNEVVRLDRASDAAWTACATRAAVAARQAAVREQVIAAIGGFPERTPLRPVVTGVVRKDGYVVEKALFESRPNHYVTAHLFIPDDPKYKAPYPGVVSPCGHSSPARPRRGTSAWASRARSSASRRSCTTRSTRASAASAGRVLGGDP